MSKTVDDLVKIGRAARTAYIMQRQGVAGILPDAERAATIAIVRALRDEIVGYQWAENKLNEILGDTAEARSAGVLAVESREGAMISEAPEAPATAPAPAVCVWTKGRDIFDGTRWGLPSCCAWTFAGVDYEICPNCKKPIKFTEAK